MLCAYTSNVLVNGHGVRSQPVGMNEIVNIIDRRAKRGQLSRAFVWNRQAEGGGRVGDTLCAG